MRRLGTGLEERPNGFEFDVDVMARSLGLGGRSGRHSPFQRAVARCVKFDMALRREPSTLAVRRRMAPLPRRLLVRLPAVLQESHRRWLAAAQRAPTVDEVRRKARRMAMSLFDAGEHDSSVELELMRFGVHPAIAHETTVWVADHLARNPSANGTGETARV